MTKKLLYVGTVGFLIRIDMGESIAAATGYTLKIKKPSGSIVTWIPTIGSSTKFHYTTVSGDLNEDGAYIVQPKFTLGAWTGLGTPVKLRVYAPYL